MRERRKKKTNSKTVHRFNEIPIHQRHSNGHGWRERERDREMESERTMYG